MSTESKELDRHTLIAVAKLWRGHDGVEWNSTSTENIWLLIQDAVGIASK